MFRSARVFRSLRNFMPDSRNASVPRHDEVEQRFATTRRVEDYERLIGYSSKTLSRAARAATGLNAKEYIDQRVLLEGRRLLAHTRLSAGEVAQRLGFSELTNFIKFFRRNGGESPSEFRRRGSFVEPDLRVESCASVSIARVHGMVNIGLPLAVADAGTSSCITSQCSTSFPSHTRKMSTATSGFSAQPT